MIDEPKYRAWKEETFGNEYMIWHDGLLTWAVTRLEGEARAHAVAMLRFGLSLGDAHAGEALAAMRELDAAPALRAQLATAGGAERVRLALAVHEMAEDPALAEHLVAVLEGPGHWSERIDAAIGLRRFAGEEDERALERAVARDPEYLVRNHACESLLARWGVKPRDISKHPAIFARICGPREGEPTDADFARYAEAVVQLRALRR